MSKGTSQKERGLAALNAEHFKVDDRSLNDLLKEAQQLAKSLRFQQTKEKNPSDWSPFFEDAERYLPHLFDAARNVKPTSSDCPPHLALFLAFLKLYGYTQSQLNELTSAHLNFFYSKILGENRKKAIPDKVYVFPELQKNIERYQLQKGEKLSAGKDKKGEDIIYTTDQAVSLNQAKIIQLKALHRSVPNNSAIYIHPSVNSADGFGAPLAPGEGWYPFGDTTKTPRISAAIGFGFISPMLLLKEGKRIIRITFSLNAIKDKFTNLALTSEQLVAQLTSVKGWITTDVEEFSFDKEKMEIAILLNDVDPEISPYDKSIHGSAFSQTDWPVLKVMLKPGYSFDQYDFLQSIRFTRITIATGVEGTTALTIRNDYGELDAAKAFHPFGFSPVRGSNFYAAIPETFYKPLQGITLQINWKGLPENFKVYYEGYLGPTNSLVRDEQDFKVKVAIRLQKKWYDLPNALDTNGEYSLFGKTISLDLGQAADAKYFDPNNENGLIRLTFTSPTYAFGHALYPAVYAKAIITQLQNQDAPIPNEPYTPVIEFIEGAYTASDTINVGQRGNAPFQYFHLKPFGIEVFNLDQNVGGFKNQALISGEFYHGGSLFIGIQNFLPPQQLSIFFEIKELTLHEKPDPGYFYLSDSGWKLLYGNQILSDTTRGLKQTGIILLNLPEDMSSRNATMPKDTFWIMIAVKDRAENFDQILNIRTNGVSCTLLMKNPDELEKVETVPPLSITTPLKKIKEIKKIEQPNSSFGGRPTETTDDYFLRVSEKLRHKMRGVSAWDIERIILEQFPEIYKVKCLQHVDSNGRIRPGSVHVIVIPFVNPRRETKILKPFVTNSTLTIIKEYIQKLASPHAKFIVTNPEYEEIKIVAQINFSSQVDAGLYIKKMQTDLQYFLSPWAFRENNDIQLGSKVYRSSIIEFIESRPYVNFISTIQVLTNNTVIDEQVIDVDEKTIIISSKDHQIEAIASDGSRCQANQGIEEMIVDINFEVQ